MIYSAAPPSGQRYQKRFSTCMLETFAGRCPDHADKCSALDVWKLYATSAAVSPYYGIPLQCVDQTVTAQELQLCTLDAMRGDL